MSTKQTNINLFNYSRRATVEVNVGGVKIGNGNAIKVQSMTNTGTMDTEGSVEQVIRIVDKGGELVRLTTQGNREAVNLGNIKEQLLARGYRVPLVADVHFNASVADTATKYADKVRVNPGNYVDTASQRRNDTGADSLTHSGQRPPGVPAGCSGSADPHWR